MYKLELTICLNTVIKGKQINYLSLKMSEYLLPYNDITQTDQIQIFNIRNRMVHIKSNFSENDLKCLTGCGNKEDMEHLYYCDILSYNDNIHEKPPYINIYSAISSLLTAVIAGFCVMMDIK